MPEETMLKDIEKMPLLAATLVLITFIGTLLKTPLMIPPFAASLFMIYMREGSEFAHWKNVFFGHLLAFASIFLGPFIVNSIPLSGPLLVSSAIGITLLIAGVLMALLRIEHPPAIATIFVFFEATTGWPETVSGVPFQKYIAFFVGLAIVTGLSYYSFRDQ